MNGILMSDQIVWSGELFHTWFLGDRIDSHAEMFIGVTMRGVPVMRMGDCLMVMAVQGS